MIEGKFNKNRTNCPNCGAALEWGKPHCAFCGTRIIDLTMLDFNSNTPTAFVLRMPTNSPEMAPYKDKDVYISMLAKPELGLITVTADSPSVYGGWGGARVVQYDNSRDVEMQVTLRSYTPPGQKELLKVIVEDKK